MNKPKKRLVYALRYRIAVTIFLLEAIMMAVVLWNTFSYSHSSTRTQYQKTEQVILNLLNDLSRSALLTGEIDELQYHLEKVTADPHIIKVLIADEKNKIIISSDFKEVGTLLPQLNDTEELFWLQESAGQWGTIAIQFSNKELTAATNSLLKRAVTIALFGMLFISMAGLAIGYLLSHRVERLQRAATEFSHGNLYAQANIEGNDEIGLLGEAFDKMARQIHHHIDELNQNQQALQKGRDELEIRVLDRTRELSIANAELKRMAQVDGLTQIANRRYFDEMLVHEWKRSMRNSTTISLLLLDIDYFKPYNDYYGHQAGDRCLQQVALAIAKTAMQRSGDLAARYGGEEFAVILPDTDAEGALAVAENVRR